MKTPSNKRFKLMCLALMVSLLLTGCALLPTTISDLVTGADDTVTISRAEYDRLQRYAELDEIWQIVEQYYYQEPDTEAMLDGAEMGLLYGLGDPYTYYYTPDQYAQLWADDEGEYAGIGIQIMGDYTTGLCTISRVFLDSPALDAGLRKGDVLTRVEDIDVVTTTLQDAVNIMRGEPGTPVNLQVQRGDQLLDFVVQRAVVHVNWVNSCMLDGDVGYISLYEFSGDCSPSFAVHLDNLMNQGAKALVIDLRDNPGGWVDDAQKVADMFLQEGNVASLVYRDGTTELYTTTTDGKENPIPLVVLVNEYSASASEILAGALQDRGRATIVGTQTFGKGVVQYVLPVGTRGAGMQLTVAQYYTPNGNEVHKVGITPDIEATLPEGDTTMYDIGDLDDAQLKAAYEVALGLIEP
ncbi:MAG TPA: S41 family peptidase [Candidatus Limiplasma pullistercoris]|nr:S41 family peptidase [Candidatus Limiplasma pullistercoris]